MFNFRKISAIGASALMVGMTMGIAAAANYPAPFVVGGNADVAVVYGTGAGVSVLDAVEAGNIQSNLQSFLTGTSGGTSTSTSGEVVSLDTSATRIWLNTSINTAKTTLTKTDLPTVLKDYTFEGDVSSKITTTMKLYAKGAAGGDHSNAVVFQKQPKSSNDPVIGLSMNTSGTLNPLYNLTATMSAINFTDPDSIGSDISLFGQKFTVSSDTTLTKLVLLKEANKLSLSSDAPSASVTVGGKDYTIELISASDTAATVKVTDSTGASDSKEVSEANSKKIQGLQVAVQTADETNLKLSASIIAGTDKVSLTSGSTVTSGDNNDPVDGTLVYIVGSNTVGTTNATTQLAVAVFAPDSSNDALLPGGTFVDPVFGSLKVDFVGLSSPLDDANRESIGIQSSGDTALTVEMTDSNGNTKTVPFAYNASYATNQATSPQVYLPANWRLSDDSNFSIFPFEGANLTEDDYTILGNEDYGHLVQVTQIYNASGTDYTQDEVKFSDQFSGDTYSTSFTSEGSGTVSIDGKQYTVTFLGSGDTGYATVKFPTSDSGSSTTFVLYPTIETKNGANLAFYEPLNLTINGTNGTATASTVFNFPDGDGYTAITFTYVGIDTGDNWTITGGSPTPGGLVTNTSGNYSAVTIGQLVYNFSMQATPNRTTVYLMNPENIIANITSPSLVLFEGKDNNNAYEAIVIDTEAAPAGTSTDGAGVNSVRTTTSYYNASATLQSDSDITQDIDWFGTFVTTDASDSDQKIATISYPKSQVYAQLYVGESSSSVSSSTAATSGTQLGDVLVKDSEVSSVSSKNLIVVGGSCINAVAANVLGGAYCGAGFTDATGVGSGQFLIQSVADKYTTGKVALVVAGYDVSDTVNAAKYLRTQTVDTTADKKYKGTTSTSAELVVE